MTVLLFSTSILRLWSVKRQQIVQKDSFKTMSSITKENGLSHILSWKRKEKKEDEKT